MLSFILTPVLLLVALHQIFYWVYVWQLKEYRIDRFKAGLRTRADWRRLLLGQFDLRTWWRPKITLRATVTIALVVFILGNSLLDLGRSALVIFVLLAPVIVSLGVGATSPVFIIGKWILVQKAKRKMQNFQGVVIGVTGSYGKSSTKEMLTQVLSQKSKVKSTLGNDNSEIGVAQTVLKRLKGDEDYFVVEMGAYRTGEIKAICEIVRPKIGIITGIGDQHLELFGSVEKITRAKYELIEALPGGGKKYIAGEDFKLSEAKGITVFKDHVEFSFAGETFRVNILGKELVRNILAVVKVAQGLGLSAKEISEILKKADTSMIYPKLLGERIIDNSYNSSRESFLSALAYLSVWKGCRKVVVTPGMMELGEKGEKNHLEIGRALRDVDVVLVTSPNYFSELNFSGNAKLVTSHKELVVELKHLAKDPKTVFLFQNRVPRIVIDSVLRG